MNNYIQGRHTYGDPPKILWGSDGTLTVGSFCSLAPGIKVWLGGNHRTDWITTFPINYMWKIAGIEGIPCTKGDVTIGNDVWIGQDVVILSGVTIGDGAVIGAYSVVPENVPPYEIWCGNPAEYKKHRFPVYIISRLLAIKWWEWPDEKIKEAVPLLQSPNVEGFLKYAEAE